MSISATHRTRLTRSTAMLVSDPTAGAVFAASTGAPAAEATRTTPAVSAATDEAVDDAQWEALLNTMISIPEDVLEQGDAATITHLKQQPQDHNLPQGQDNSASVGPASGAWARSRWPPAAVCSPPRSWRRPRRCLGIALPAMAGMAHGLGHGHANALVAHTLAENSGQ
ncbi:hypothetical protein STVIR_3920 [Streptomyces viridochromogenes Tue57]|uniref:Uncharacterized protein n=1 Tax=Streptomyces viridochromogenes Tue57 TaxID=1160705 RepID=L8PG28_STRVR|nr:hypothetical protein STVIR_3920 [Streptomyces viridochromogenes Tue57]